MIDIIECMEVQRRDIDRRPDPLLNKNLPGGEYKKDNFVQQIIFLP
jgi:hypothetical protein